MKSVVILGSTGSIGESALRVVEALSDDLKVVGLAVNRNVTRVLEQAERFGVKTIAVSDPTAAAACEKAAPSSVTVLHGDAGLAQLAQSDDADVVLCAVVGTAGLAPVLAALENGTDVALATKEVLVAAGRLVTETATRHHARLLPVDSEHSAVFQCLAGGTTQCDDSAVMSVGPANVKKIILTASGGPFGDQQDVDLSKVTVAEALDHPSWNMGRKITVDSATLMNKGLEIIEAHWLFDMPLELIDVVIHPESIVHSIVEFIDGAMICQMSLPDMRFAIQYALTWPRRVDSGLPELDLTAAGPLNFHQPDETRFPSLQLARGAVVTGGTMPTVLNAANETAVQQFLSGGISFSGIWHAVEEAMNKHSVIQDPSLDDILAADTWARQTTEGT